MRSPGAVRGTKIARPSARRPTPSPPAAMPVIVTRSFTEAFPQPRLAPGGRTAGRPDGQLRVGGGAVLVGEQRGRDRDCPFETGQGRGGEHALAHTLQVCDVQL